jgi:hypothetical protein
MNLKKELEIQEVHMKTINQKQRPFLVVILMIISILIVLLRHSIIFGFSFQSSGNSFKLYFAITISCLISFSILALLKSYKANNLKLLLIFIGAITLSYFSGISEFLYIKRVKANFGKTVRNCQFYQKKTNYPYISYCNGMSVISYNEFRIVQMRITLQEGNLDQFQGVNLLFFPDSNAKSFFNQDNEVNYVRILDSQFAACGSLILP